MSAEISTPTGYGSLVLDSFFWGMSVLSFLMSFAIGSNETDALATAYSSGGLTLI
jgi:hypothetical protein